MRLERENVKNERVVMISVDWMGEAETNDFDQTQRNREQEDEAERYRSH